MKTKGRSDTKRLAIGLSGASVAAALVEEPERPVVVVVTEDVSEEVAAVVLRFRYEALVNVAVAGFLRRLPLARAEAPGTAQAVAVVAGGCR